MIYAGRQQMLEIRSLLPYRVQFQTEVQVSREPLTSSPLHPVHNVFK